MSILESKNNDLITSHKKLLKLYHDNFKITTIEDNIFLEFNYDQLFQKFNLNDKNIHMLLEQQYIELTNVHNIVLAEYHILMNKKSNELNENRTQLLKEKEPEIAKEKEEEIETYQEILEYFDNDNDLKSTRLQFRKLELDRNKKMMEELNITCDVDVVRKTEKYNFKCTKCFTIHNTCLKHYIRRLIKCCEVDGKQFKGRKSHTLIDGRNSQVNYLLVEEKIKKICFERKAECLNIEQYINHHTQLKFECFICKNIWLATYNNISNHNSWCPTCGANRNGEDIQRAILQYLLSTYKFTSIRPNWLKNPETMQNLEIDCYNEELKLGLEKNGIQHYKVEPFLHRPPNWKSLTFEELKQACQEKFNTQIKNDNIKIKLCEELKIDLIVTSHLDAKKGIPFLKRLIYDKIKHRKECIIDPNSTWFNSHEISLENISAKYHKCKEIILNYISNKNLKYTFVNLDVQIFGVDSKFELFCSNHETPYIFTTYLSNLIKSSRRCPKCSKENKKVWTNENIKLYIIEKDPTIEITNDDFKSANGIIKFKCNKCNLENLKGRKFQDIFRTLQTKGLCENCN